MNERQTGRQCKIGEPMLTADRLRKLVTYNPGTGVFRWKVDRNNSVSEGDIAGHEHSRTKRRLIAIDGHLYQAGRLAWLYMKSTALMVIQLTFDGLTCD